MSEPRRAIFRTDAIQRYAQSREQSVLPRFVSPRIFIYLWILLGLLLVSGLMAWFAQVPIYADGPAIVVESSETHDGHAQIVVVALLPAEIRSQLRVGQTQFLHLDTIGVRVSQPIIAVEPEVMSPAAVQRQFNLSVGAAATITRPVAVTITRLAPPSTGLPSTAYTGSVGRVEVEIGSRRVISLLPLAGRFFGE